MPRAHFTSRWKKVSYSKRLTPEEFTALVGGWFKTQVSLMLNEAAQFAIGTGAQVDSPELTNALNLAKKLATHVKEVAKSYLLDAVDLAKQNVIGTSAANKLTRWGFSPREANEVVGELWNRCFQAVTINKPAMRDKMFEIAFRLFCHSHSFTYKAAKKHLDDPSTDSQWMSKILLV